MSSNTISSGLNSMLHSQALFMFMNKRNNTGSEGEGGGSGVNDFIYMLLFTTIFATSIPIILNNIANLITFKFDAIVNRLRDLFRNKDLVQISLCYQINLSKYGNCKTYITNDTIGVLNYIRVNIYKLKGLYSLSQESGVSRYNYDNETNDFLPLYKIKQVNNILLYEDDMGKTIYIRTKTADAPTNTEDKPTSKITTLILSSKTMTLREIDNFIQMCSKEYNFSVIDDHRRFIYTLVNFDDDDVPVFRREEFVPYSDFDNIYNDEAENIKKKLDFFVSKEGKEWYKRRNIPYHFSILLHGIPGTGKSAIACAIAKRYDLNIMRIKLSNIKTNRQFINAFKCRKPISGSPEYKYDQLLYLFDEIDTETNDVLLDRKFANNAISNTKNVTTITAGGVDGREQTTSDTSKKVTSKQYGIGVGSIDDKLSLGTILEELSGINQMWGRKLVFISNYPERIDKALRRPGRINMDIKLSYSSRSDTIKIIENFFDECLPNIMHQHIPHKLMTPAEIVNLCLTSDTISDLLTMIKNKYIDDPKIDTDMSIDI